jgi:hypothetical protein
VVWFVLIVELLFELLIRPSNYGALVYSDKAFAPSTARLLNRFHLFCESLALFAYLPQSVCGFTDGCDSTLDAIKRTLWALTSTNLRDAFLGRILFGLVFLRSFGLARHWKQMWLNHTYEKIDQESCKFVILAPKIDPNRPTHMPIVWSSHDSETSLRGKSGTIP